MNPNKPIRRCVCLDTPFEAVLQRVSEEGWTETWQITAAMGCGGSCGLCLPYLAQVISTGETEFAFVLQNSEGKAG